MASSSVTSGLFVPSERWGWEFVDPGSPRPSPLLFRQPVWREPPPLPAPTASASSASNGHAWVFVAIIAIATAIGLSFQSGALALGVLIVAGLISFLTASNQVSSRQREAQAAVDRWQRDRQLGYEAFAREFAGWQQAIAGHNYWEWQRFERADLWYPLELGTPTDRVDVVGGVPDGWRQLLTTFGATVVARGTPLLIMDLTQERVADSLVELSRGNWKVREIQLPRDVDQLDLLAGLTADEVAEVLAEAAETMRGAPDPALRATDADVLRAVAQRLDGSFTIRRLTAGLRVLQRTYDPDGGSLTPEEVTTLSRHIDLVGSGERVQEQLRFLRVALDMLADTASTAGVAPATVDGLWRDANVTVIATDNPIPARKDFTDRVLFHSLLQRLRNRQSAVKGQVLVIAGADHLGAQALEAMAKQTRARGVRLVYFFDHLRDSTQRLLGGSHSATMIMRLGSAAEAAAAAEYIGRGYSFTLSQITRQLGITDTLGGGDSSGTSTSRTSSPQGYSDTMGDMSQQMSNWSNAISVTGGSTEQRVYEFTVEPQKIQTLPMTVLILVEGDAQGRRAAVADCNPALASVDRVADHPRTASKPGLTR